MVAWFQHPAGKFTGDRDVGDDWPLVAVIEVEPALVEALVAQVGTGNDRAGCVVPAPQHGVPWPVGRLVVPGGLDQQPTGMGVTGLRDRGHHPPLAAGCLAGGQAEERANAARIEPGPVTDLDGQPEPGQGADPTQATLPVDDRRELTIGGHRFDGLVELVTAGHREHDVGVSAVERRLRAGLVEPDPAQPLVMGTGPGCSTGVPMPVPQQQLRQPVT